MNDSLDRGSFEAISSNVAQGVNITQEQINAIQESVHQSAQAAAQRKQSKALSSGLSGFLSFIFKSIYNNEGLYQSLYQVFFVHKNPESGLTERHKTINTELLVGLFVPFYPQKAQEFGLIKLYDRYYDFYSPLHLTKYLQSVKSMMHAFHGYHHHINHIAYIQCLAYIIIHFKQARSNDTLPQNGPALGQLIQQEVYR